MKTKLSKTLDKTLDALPMTGAAIALVVLTCVFSGTLREILLQADMGLLAAAVALLPLTAALVALTLGARRKGDKRKQQQPQQQTKRSLQQAELMRRRAMLHATYDLNDQP